MNAITTTTSAPMPVRSDVSIRLATLADVPFMDALQKKHSKQLGYFPTKQFEDYIAGGHVLIAEEGSGVRVQGSGGECISAPSLNPEPRTLNPLGYIIAKDRYLKRDELGVIYQLCVAPNHQRALVGASLLKAVFERSAYGCKLYCCWCAQDLDANHFWESMGFLPIAFRAGSDRKRRVHIFWQRRINADDTGERATPYWYPSQTNAGAIREDRLVFPIPPGTHWSDVKPVQLPAYGTGIQPVSPNQRHGSKARATKDKTTAKARRSTPPLTTASCRLHFIPPAPPVKEKPKRAAKPKVKNDPTLVAAARELRDRYLERVNERPMFTASGGKYDVSRSLPAIGPRVAPHLMLPPAA